MEIQARAIAGSIFGFGSLSTFSAVIHADGHAFSTWTNDLAEGQPVTNGIPCLHIMNYPPLPTSHRPGTSASA
jgi:hypothetical protein